MKRKLLWTFAGVAVACYAIYCICDFVHWSRVPPTRELEHQLAGVTNGFTGTPLGIQQNQEFLSRLKALEASSAPIEVRQALNDYIAAYGAALDAVKAGRDASIHAQPMAESKERLRQALRKYDR